MYQSEFNPYQAREFLREKYNVKSLYHITHIDNLKSIMTHGLLSHNMVSQRLKTFNIQDISLSEVQNIRQQRSIDGVPLHNYVPLYFSPRNPMLFRRRDYQEDLVILCMDSILLFENLTLFTDGNAASSDTYFYRDINYLEELNWDIIYSKYWNNYEDGKRIKCSEILIYEKVEISNIFKIFCYSEKQKDTVSNIINYKGIEAQVSNYFYF